MDCYEEILYSNRHMSFAAPHEQEIKDTICEIGQLLNQIYEQRTPHESQEASNVQSIILNEPLCIVEECEPADSPPRGILKNKNHIIETLESATEKIIEGLQGLSLVAKQQPAARPSCRQSVPIARQPLQPACGNTVVARLYQHQKAKEDRLREKRAEQERLESNRCRQRAKRVPARTIPLFKRVDQILEEKNKWIEEQKCQKLEREEAYYNSFTFHPATQAPAPHECLDQFIENQRQWLHRKNEALVNQKLQKENVELTFKPSLCPKSNDILKRNSTSRQQFSSRPYSSKQSEQQYPSVRNE